LFVAAPEVQVRLRPVLESAGRWEIAAANTVLEVLATTATYKPDLFLLSDSLDARQILESLRDRQLLARIPAFVLTDGDPQRFLALGASRVLTPDPATLPLLLRNAYEESRLRLALGHIRSLGGDAFVREMADLFRDNAPKQLATARQCLAAGDLEAVRRTCHSLKSSAGNIGAAAVQDLAERAEHLAHRCEPAPLPQLLNDIDDTLERFLGRLPQVGC
jgi:HPt (histidine-containing phosphotransfer) domain-containing protein